MQQLAVVVPLKEGSEQRAAALLDAGPPFDPGEAGFERHAVYLTGREAVFVFEGPEVEWRLDDLASDFLQPLLQDALHEWRRLVDGEPRYARQLYCWKQENPASGA